METVESKMRVQDLSVVLLGKDRRSNIASRGGKSAVDLVDRDCTYGRIVCYEYHANGQVGVRLSKYARGYFDKLNLDRKTCLWNLSFEAEAQAVITIISSQPVQEWKLFRHCYLSTLTVRNT